MSITFEKVLVLKNISIFAHSSEMALADLIAVGEEKTYKDGETVIEEKQTNRHLYIVLSGMINFVEKDKVIAEVGPRHFFGETTVFSPAALPYAIVAAEKTTVLRFTQNQLYQMLALHSSLAIGFIGELSRRLRLEQTKNS
ncbi:MAG: Crp/Fnr family transcriptional regulator [Lactobacillales bacterium]|jgi:CRP-like cAMP-binding protein|nr:Crp/Fnr family transcriptional regulator [Lactobacillales bacterium]